MSSVSTLGPIDPASVPDAETEKSSPWIVRKLAGVSRRSQLSCCRPFLMFSVPVNDRKDCNIVMGNTKSIGYQCGVSFAGEYTVILPILHLTSELVGGFIPVTITLHTLQGPCGSHRDCCDGIWFHKIPHIQPVC